MEIPAPQADPPVAWQPAVPDYAAVRLRYLQRSRVLVRGPVTGRHYEFSGENPDQAVDARDAVPLERTGFFRRV